MTFLTVLPFTHVIVIFLADAATGVDAFEVELGDGAALVTGDGVEVANGEGEALGDGVGDGVITGAGASCVSFTLITGAE